jgi:GTP-binding protein
VLGQLPPPPGPDERVPALRVAVVGRPNVGKSSYINRLLRSERVLVSATPGTTRDSVEIPFRVGHGGASRDYVLIDTAGMRRSGKVRDAVEQYSLLRAERSVEGADLVAVVVDATQGPTAQDKKIASLVLKHRKGCVLLVNKWDMAPGTQRKCLPLIEAQMPFLSHCPVVFISSKTGFNIRRSIDAIDAVAANMQAWLPTGVLNRTLKAAYERVRPPSAAGKPLKIYYAAQVGAAPPRFRVFVNRPRGIPPAYVQYLTKALRRAFALDGVPVRLDFVPRHGPGTQKVARKKKH